MSTTKIPFGPAVADVLERRQLEESVATRIWTIADVEWFENRLQKESVDQDGTFYRDRLRMMQEAFKRSHERGDFVLPEEMTRAQFAEHVSMVLDPVTGESKPGPVRYLPRDVFDRPEITAISSTLVRTQTISDGRGGPGFRQTEIHQPVMDLLRSAHAEGRIMGPDYLGGPVMAVIRGAAGEQAIRQGRATFCGETAAERERRVAELFENAAAAVALCAELGKVVGELAGLEKIDDAQGGRFLRSSRQAVADVLAEVPREAAKVGAFERLILEGDEMKGLTKQLARIDQLLAEKSQPN